MTASQSNRLIRGMEELFARWGIFVPLHPYPVILASILVTVMCSLGFLQFRMEHQANLLWIPVDSPYNIRQEWIDRNFRSSVRYENMMYTADNVLTPENLRKMLEIHKRVGNIEVGGRRFSELCARVPIADIFQAQKRRKRQVNDTEEEYYDPWAGEYYYDYDEEIEIDLPRINFEKYGKTNKNSDQVIEGEDDLTEGLPYNIYCDLVTTLNTKCQEHSLLEIWRYDEELIMTTTQEEILDAVNRLNKSPWYGYGANYAGSLGGIKYNSSGHIVGATTTQMVWVLEVPEDSDIVDSQGSGLELELADQDSLEWEEEFIQIGLNSSTKTTTVLPNAAKSFGDVSTQAIFFDAFLMAGGYLLMFLYTGLMLGRLNRLEVRLYLSMAGLISIAMGMAIALGITSWLGFPYTPMHAVLPFICLGIGIDDMFVILQCWGNAKEEVEEDSGTAKRLSMAMRHAGVAVTVTTVTDVFAFGVGAVTQMPGLQSFCVCTALSLGSIYLLQVSWFLAWLSLDERRLSAGRDGCVPCIKHRDYQPSACSQKDFSDIILGKVLPLFTTPFFQVFVLLLTAGALTGGIIGSINIEQTFKPWLLLPPDSYMRKWLDIHDMNFPDNGFGTNIYTGAIDSQSLSSLEELSRGMNAATKPPKRIIKSVSDWWGALKSFGKEEGNYTEWTQFADDDLFQDLLSKFLFSSGGTIYKDNFKFDGELQCNKPAPKILASKMWFTYVHFSGPDEHIPAKRRIEDMTAGLGLNESFSHAKIYAAWETDEIIGFELWRNIGLAMAAVAVITLLLLQDVRLCCMVLLSVTLTVTDIVGFLHFWDITIDIISCVNIVLAIGLCVDYSVHIGHAYLVSESGDRKERARQAVSSIGPAVFNGGFTTFLALVLLGASSSHVFQSFFKVFVLTVLFGLFHGLLLFPVLLSIIGPERKTSGSSSESQLSDSENPPQDTSPISVVGAATISYDSNKGLDNPIFIPDVSTYDENRAV